MYLCAFCYNFCIGIPTADARNAYVSCQAINLAPRGASAHFCERFRNELAFTMQGEHRFYAALLGKYVLSQIGPLPKTALWSTSRAGGWQPDVTVVRQNCGQVYKLQFIDKGTGRKIFFPPPWRIFNLSALLYPSFYQTYPVSSL